MIKIFFMLLILYLIYKLSKIEGFKNNNTTFKATRNKYNGMMNDYLIRENDVSPLPVGFYSSLLNVAGVRDEHRFLESPISETTHSFANEYFLNNKITDCPDLPGNCDTFNSFTNGEIFKDNKDPLPDPFFLFPKPGQNDKIIYEDIINTDILSAHNLNEEELVKRISTNQSNF